MIDVLSDLPESINDLELVICCGKIPGTEESFDWVLASRIDLAVKAALKNPKSVLLLSGGIAWAPDTNQTQITEADAMEKYIKTKYPDFTNAILKESNSSGSLEQLCLIKENYILKDKYKKIAIISDEIHIKRVSVLFDAVLGDEYEVFYLGSTINLYGKYRQLIEDYEDLNCSGALELVKLLPRGDHIEFKKFDKAYRDLRKLKLDQGESRLDFISPQEIIEFMNNTAN